MKTEINSENKARFFALYWNQDVLCSYRYGNGGTIYSATMKTDSLDGKWLLLKSVWKMSDKDKEEISKIVIEHPVDRHISVSDYLRSRGYALPWMGISVEKMIESGWLKLEEL